MIAIAAFCLASFFDLKNRIIPPILSYSIILFGVLLNGIIGLFWAAVCFVFSYILYIKGVWAGGDVKLFTGLGALTGFLAFPALLFAILIPLPVFAALILYHVIKTHRLRSILHFQILLSPFTLLLIFLSPSQILLILFFSLLSSAAVAAYGIYRNEVLRAVQKPVEGAIVVGGPASGITREEIAKLRHNILTTKSVPFTPLLTLGIIFVKVFL